MKKSKAKYDIIVVGGGHAGSEASLACARMGLSTLLITLRADKISEMSCNPSIGGLAKGQLVKEIDALGGEMGLAADDTAIQYRQLNRRKGPAVRSSRVQSDKDLYRQRMTSAITQTEQIDVAEAEVDSLLIKNSQVFGIIDNSGNKIESKIVIITTGTFLNGLIHIGNEMTPAGRHGEPSSKNLSKNLAELGFEIGRLKTGTVPRIKRDSIDFKNLEEQAGDEPARPFSFFSKGIGLPQVSCHITYTNPKTHEIIRDNLSKSALYSGNITGTGARYCPSIEDKIVRFADRERHQVFLEPEGLNSPWIYPNGISNSLPLNIQKKLVHSIEGLENAAIVRPGYGIEYDYVNPIELYPWLETKKIKNLFLAGQINGTSGYEEAAAQGLLAGINAALKIKGKKPYVIERSKGYIGVLIDDLVTKGTSEPYRMFTSRAEYRLILREDNADRRLCEDGFRLGLLRKDFYKKYKDKMSLIKRLNDELTQKELNPTPQVNMFFVKHKISPMKNRFNIKEILKRPGMTIENLAEFAPSIAGYDFEIKEQVEIDTKYEGYIRRQNEEVDKFAAREDFRLPTDFDYSTITSITKEVQEKLNSIKPVSLGQASRISGITPAALSVLMVHLRDKK